MKIELYRQILEKYSNIEFHEKPPRAGGRTDRHDEANNRLSKFCKRAYKQYFSIVCVCVLCVMRTVGRDYFLLQCQPVGHCNGNF